MLEAITRLLVLGLHIPDGFLSLPVALCFWIITVAAIAWAARRAGHALDDRQVPLLGVMAACIFAAQMLNFPIAGGTSGHLLGGALAAIVLGAWNGMLVMTCVIGLQALLFQDGGLVAMSANIFNMGLLTALIGSGAFYGLLTLLGRRRWSMAVAAGGAAWLSVMAAALLTALQLIASGTAPAAVVLPAMLGIHALIGIGEALITMAALAFLLTTRPDLLPPRLLDTLQGKRPALSGRALLGGGLALAALLTLLAPLASSAPDGLERVAEDLGFLGRALDPLYALLPDYTLPGVSGGLSTILAGLLGVIIVAALAYGIALRLRRRAPLAERRSTHTP
ncbi:energy-coupling factor ABC transporter permease [Kallotenue papyrolyticum]|uniref:energy-coupling factor ABC transporter permease n=1 Tax=Kallotenue papyrolyticum TaxID=1325125 RepID=UPI0004B40F99|nr:energy-coupling factor ABC transporter permease [Kallotenue papyrolyticum]